MTSYLIQGAQALLPAGLEAADIRIEDGVIAEVGTDLAPDGARGIAGRGLIAAPALVDIHGDAFERQVMPRPNVFFPMDVAVLDTDRQLAGCGVAIVLAVVSAVVLDQLGLSSQNVFQSPNVRL